MGKTDHTTELTLDDRLVARERPASWPIMHQSWDRLLFLHWELPLGVVRRLVPEPLVIDKYEGRAWLSITPLKIFGVRPILMPAVPYFSWLHELNVRTYVHYDGVPGVWFFSLDANNLPAVIGARTLFALPYFSADISMDVEGNHVKFRSKRGESDAGLTAEWLIGEDMPSAVPGTLDFFLLERYSLYAADDESIYRCRIHHKPWPIQETLELKNFSSTMASANRLPEPVADPLLHCGGPVDVEVWPLESVADRVWN
jgi:uncharacterized protein